ncbi:hypothetical protein FQN57_002200 [Myotisia sp. PD_48]|nr:hypothetical protein FQN57_002200 [Myotisia sp. PD_48]
MAGGTLGFRSPAHQAQPGTPNQPIPSPSQPVDSIETDSKNTDVDANAITDTQWKLMMEVVMAIYDYREQDGHDSSKLFHKSVNKRNVPDYYDVIKEPMALSVLKQKIRTKTYNRFSEFVRDCALIPHNAQTYNRPKSQAYEDALVIKDVFISEFRKLAEMGIISPETAELPDLGEIPEADPLPVEEEDEEDDEDEEDEDGEDSEEEASRRKRKRGPRPGSKRDSTTKDELSKTGDVDSRKKRGRPPRVDTPMEARIKAVLKGIRKLKDNRGQLKVRHFERLPDKAAYPDYYHEIKEPMAIDLIKRKSKRKKYNSVDHFMRDIDMMFNNAKIYNLPDSDIYKDANELHREAHKLSEQEKSKPDSEYLMEDGRLPLPNGISYKGDIWRVGDWVHLQNPNDASKPIIAQVYRTWQDSEGQKWVNACWYYRPEQTIHHFEKHFFPNEVVKTGQYRDHRIEEVVDRCFVMFFTRYNRGRPRGLPPTKEVYVCEARYNEEKHKLNKIKTWASCLPDEVREKDYEMDLFDTPRKIKKIPSPIRHLLKDDAKETDDLPKPTWGAENAPPIVGAVHRRPRDENESPPPEPTPSPPPQHLPLPPVAVTPNRQVPVPQTQAIANGGAQGDTAFRGLPAQPMHTRVPHIPHLPSAAQPQMISNRPEAYNQAPASLHGFPISHQQRPNPMVHQSPQLTPYQSAPNPQAYATPVNFPSYQVNRSPQVPIPPPMYNPNAPRSVETFHLRNSQDGLIQKEVKEQFQQDDQGNILFFSVPPLDIVSTTHDGLGHSIEYLAAKEKRRKFTQCSNNGDQAEETTRQALDDTSSVRTQTPENLKMEAVSFFIDRVRECTEDFYRLHYAEEATTIKNSDSRILANKREAEKARFKVELPMFSSYEPKLGTKRSWRDIN